MTASSSGAITKDDPNRTEGSWNQTVGSAKEAVGGLIGNQVCFPPPASASRRNERTLLTICTQNLKQAGAQQNAEGKGQEAQGQLSDLGSGVANRVSGAVGGAVAGITGDRDAQLKAQEQHDVGKTQQRGAEHDIQKQNP